MIQGTALHRRDLGEDQHDQDHRLGSARRASRQSCTLRPLAHPDLHCALRHDGPGAPWIINGAMNAEIFQRYVETQLVPVLRPGDVVILDNLSSHKMPGAARALRKLGA